MVDDSINILKSAASPTSEKLVALAEEKNRLTRELLDETKQIKQIKIEQHEAWIKATGRRFYVSFVTLIVMASAFYVDVVLKGQGSPFANAIADFVGFGGALL